jgi:hypothetical protein
VCPLFLLKFSGQKNYKVAIQFSSETNIRVEDTMLSEYTFRFIRKAVWGENGSWVYALLGRSNQS